MDNLILRPSEIRRRVADLTDDERERLLAALKAHHTGAVEAGRAQRSSAERLVACVSLYKGAAVELDDLRHFVAGRLPDHMVPQALVRLELLPKTRAGKIDRMALRRVDLQTPDAAESASLVEPRNDNERLLAEIWADVLGVQDISVDDDFFEVGGDSLLSIRILARAGAAGLRISPEKFFAHPTIAEQAALAETSTAAVRDAGPLTGAVPLLPIQAWFFEHIARDREHWNQSSLFRISDAIDLDVLERATRAVVLHHDALRISFRETRSGWEQRIGDPGADVPVQCADLTDVGPDELDARIGVLATSTNTDFDLARAPLLRVVLIRTAKELADRLLVVAHHLIVDAESFRVLIEDLDSACQELRAGAQVKLPAKTTSIKIWSERLRQHAHSTALREESDFWIALARQAGEDIPADFPDGAANNTVASVQTLTKTLDEPTTRALLYDVPTAFRTRINEALLAALFAAARDLSGTDSLIVDLEGHGRDSMFEDVDVSRTIGWLTTVFPVLLRSDAPGSPVALLGDVKENVRAIPRNGIGHGLIRYGGGNAGKLLRGMPDPRMLFNYLGQTDRLEPDGALFRLERRRSGWIRGPGTPRPHWVEVNAWVSDSELTVNWHYGQNLHRADTIERLAERLMAYVTDLSALAAHEDSGAVTPSDFPLAGLDRDDLDDLSDLIDEIDDDGPLR